MMKLSCNLYVYIYLFILLSFADSLLTIRGKLFTAYYDNSQIENGDLEESYTDREIQR